MPVIGVRVTDEKKVEYEEAAGIAGVSLSKWAAEALEAHVNRNGAVNTEPPAFVKQPIIKTVADVIIPAKKQTVKPSGLLADGRKYTGDTGLLSGRKFYYVVDSNGEETITFTPPGCRGR